MTTPNETLLETLCRAERQGAKPQQGIACTRAGELIWNAGGLSFGDALQLTPEDLDTLGLSRSSELIAPRGVDWLLGRPPRRVDLAHLELRTPEGARLCLSAEVEPGLVAGLPERRCEGLRVPCAALRSLAVTALALGARLGDGAQREAVPAGSPVVLELVDDRAAVVDARGRWGFVNGDGQLVIACRFEAVGRFSEGLAAARSNGRWGFIDRYGTWHCRPRFDAVRPFWHGAARVCEQGHWSRLVAGGAQRGDRRMPRERVLASLAVAGSALAVGVGLARGFEASLALLVALGVPVALVLWYLREQARGTERGRRPHRRTVRALPSGLGSGARSRG